VEISTQNNEILNILIFGSKRLDSEEDVGVDVCRENGVMIILKKEYLERMWPSIASHLANLVL